MSETRPSAELVAEIRRLFASGSVLNIGEQRALIRELDAVTRERNKHAADWIAQTEKLGRVTRERDAERGISAKLLERIVAINEALGLRPESDKHLDAISTLTRERDEYPALIAKREERHRYELDFAHSERDDARKVTDEMVERAAIAMFEKERTPAMVVHWHELPTYDAAQYVIRARVALTAALGGAS